MVVRACCAIVLALAFFFRVQSCRGWSAGNAKTTGASSSRRAFVTTATAASYAAVSAAPAAWADDPAAATTTAAAVLLQPAEVSVAGEVKKLFNEGRALESQGNMAAAQRLYAKVTLIAPRFIYGWSNLGNTQTALGDLARAAQSYDTAIDLCRANLRTASAEGNSLGVKRCSDLYILLLNRGSLRLNNGMPQEALSDLRQAETLRGRPDALVLQNLARALEINGFYSQADRDYTTAISMTANEVNPFWLRSAIVKYQLGDVQGGYDLLKRVENRFPAAPEVRAASAVFLAARGDPIAARQKFLELPNRQRLKYADREFLTRTVSWPPAMIDAVHAIAVAVGDSR